MSVERDRRVSMGAAVAGLTGIVALVIDQLSKIWATSSLGGGRDVPILGDWLSFRLHFNPGAAFSLADGSTWVLALVASVVVVGLPFVFRSATSRPWAVALGLIWGGAAGNLADRLLRQPGFGTGHVVDFIRYGDWFIGNVADIALVVGVAVLGILSLVDSDSSPSASRASRSKKAATKFGASAGADAGASSETRQAGASAQVSPGQAGEAGADQPSEAPGAGELAEAVDCDEAAVASEAAELGESDEAPGGQAEEPSRQTDASGGQAEASGASAAADTAGPREADAAEATDQPAQTPERRDAGGSSHV